LVSSLFRGLDRLAGLGWASMARACFALIIATTIGHVFGWRIGIAAEAVSTATLGVLFLLYVGGLVRANAASVSGTAQSKGDVGQFKRSDGFLLFAASLVSLIPMSFDRWWISTFETATIAAQYAFVSVWLVGGYTATSIYVQKYGPDTVRAVALGQLPSVIRRTILHAGILALILVAGTVVTFVGLYLLPHYTFWDKYDLSVSVLLLAALGVGTQVAPVFDWTLIALNGERFVLICASIFALVTAVLFAVVTATGLGFSGYVGAMTAGRLCQLVTHLVLIERLSKGRTPVAQP
jgi:hypothetical protein